MCLLFGCTPNPNYRIPKADREMADRILPPIWYQLDRGGINTSTPVAKVLSRYTPIAKEAFGSYTAYYFKDKEVAGITLIAEGENILVAQAASDIWRHTFFVDSAKTSVIASVWADYAAQKKANRKKKTQHAPPVGRGEAPRP